MKELFNRDIKYKIMFAITILGLIGIISGTSYAILKGSTTSENEQIIKTGSVLLKLTEGYESMSKRIGVLSDEEGLLQEDSYSFNIKNIGNSSAQFDLKLVNKVPSDYSGEVLDDQYIKIGLEINDEEHGPFNLEEVNNIIDSDLISKNEIINYELRIWLDKEKETEISNMEDYKSFLTLEVEATQGDYSASVNAAKILMSKVGQSGLEKVIHGADSTLQIGATKNITEYRFRGGNDVVTNNYVYFNCSDPNNQTADTCELYRIIGVFPVDDGNGNIENRIKLIKETSYDDKEYNWNEDGTKNWAEATTLNTEFNTTYWNTINEKYQALVGNSKYYLGGYSWAGVTNDMYKYERKIEGTDYYYSGNPVNWTGKIALMYASDYGYGANNTCSDTIFLNSYSSGNSCINNWLYIGSKEWLLPHNPDYSYVGFYIDPSGYVYTSRNPSNDSYTTASARPVFYLNADTEFNGGSGSSDNPYQLKTSIDAAEMLISKVGQSGLEEVTHNADKTLQIGATKDITEYRFRGGNDVVTNNYVYFNCSDLDNQTEDTCELYRIIGVFPVDDGTGKIENRVKLIKATAYNDNTNYEWDFDSGNNWAKPHTLNTEFNTTYYNSLNTKYQSLIGDAKYYLGGYNASALLTSTMYQYERKISGTDYYYSGNSTNWIGKIALMYVSDYGYGANSACSDSTNLFNYSNDSCYMNNWLYYTGMTQWLLAHNSSGSSNMFHVRNSNGYVECVGAGGYSNPTVRPVFYLKSNAKIVDGEGSSRNPYQLMW